MSMVEVFFQPPIFMTIGLATLPDLRYLNLCFVGAQILILEYLGFL